MHRLLRETAKAQSHSDRPWHESDSDSIPGAFQPAEQKDLHSFDDRLSVLFCGSEEFYKEIGFTQKADILPRVSASFWSTESTSS